MLSILSSYFYLNISQIVLISTSPSDTEYLRLKNFAQENGYTVIENKNIFPQGTAYCLEFPRNISFDRMAALNDIIDQINKPSSLAPSTPELAQNSVGSSSSMSYSASSSSSSSASSSNAQASNTAGKTISCSSYKQKRTQQWRNRDKLTQRIRRNNIAESFKKIELLVVSNPFFQIKKMTRVKILELLLKKIKEYVANIAELREQLHKLHQIMQDLEAKIKPQKHTENTSRIEQLKKAIQEKNITINNLEMELAARSQLPAIPTRTLYSTSTASLAPRSLSGYPGSLFQQHQAIQRPASSARYGDSIETSEENSTASAAPYLR